MEFGRVPESELDQIDFSLLADPAFNSIVLNGMAVKNPKVYIGCAKWGRTEWLGKIYPPKTKEKDFLQHYVQHYNSIELNATHYQLYATDTIQKWADKASGKDFLFCPKMYNGVTHFGSLKGKDVLTAEFLKGVLAFGKNLGPIFIQVSESFSPARKSELFAYLQSLPKEFQFFVEVRHQEWFANAVISKEFFTALRQLNMGAVITDASGRRDCAHMCLPVAKTFIRYVGNSLHPSDYTRIDVWINRIKYWLDKGVREVYFFMHMHNEATSPELTVYLVDKLNKECGLKLPKPIFVSQQQNLF
ncbi:hypothetical protein BH11BAC5_BH11BAC5_05160 [soil metagenome]